MFKTFQIKENFEAKHKNMEYITRKYLFIYRYTITTKRNTVNSCNTKWL